MTKPDFDIVIAGAGIVGLATALALTESHPKLSIAIVEKEPAVAQHQTSHNSGVVHSGIYYRPGSFRAKLCIKGASRLEEFCQEHALPFVRCGKVIVATSEDEVPRLEALYRRGIENGVPGLELIDKARLREIEPNAVAVRAIWSPNTAITDYGLVAKTMAQVAASRGAKLVLGNTIEGIREERECLTLATSKGQITTRFLINCSGLYADKLARAAGQKLDIRIVPFRGEYYRLKPECRTLVRGTIYPVPDPKFPFLGVHLTSTVHGEVEAGPNAVLAFAREGYSWTTVSLADMADAFGFPGVWRLARRHWRMAIFEYYRSISKHAFVRSLQKLVPDIEEKDVERYTAGVRAQAMNRDGSLVDDFIFSSSRRALHVLNAPSPAATASLAIGSHITAEMTKVMLQAGAGPGLTHLRP